MVPAKTSLKEGNPWGKPARGQVQVQSHSLSLLLLQWPQSENSPKVHQLMNMVQPVDGLLFPHEKEWNSDSSYMDDIWKHAKWKKKNPDTETYILYDSIYVKCPDLENP